MTDDLYNPYAPPDARVAGGGVSQSGGGGELPWENRAQLGFWPALRDTSLLLTKTPSRAFGMARKQGDYNSPLLFAVLFGTVFGMIGQMWSVMFNFSAASFMGQDAAAGAGLLGIGTMVFMLFLLPIFTVIGLFIGGAMIHLCLMIVGGLQNSKAGFEGTVRALSYSYVGQIAYVIPVVGALFAIFWIFPLYVIGLRELHDTTTGKAVAAVLLPTVVCCGLLVLVFGAAMAAAFGGAALGGDI